MTRLACLLATSPRPEVRNRAEAKALAEEAVRLTKRRDPGALDALAAALAESGARAEAARVAIEAERQAAASGEGGLEAAIRERRRSYERREPYREPVRTEGRRSPR